MPFLVMAILLLGVPVSVGYSQDQTSEEEERMVLIHAVNLLLPFLVSIEDAERKLDGIARSDWERRKLQKRIDLTLQAIFDPDMVRCIDLMRKPFREGAVCEDAWFNEPDPRPGYQEENEDMCEMALLGNLSNCVGRGLMKIPISP